MLHRGGITAKCGGTPCWRCRNSWNAPKRGLKEGALANDDQVLEDLGAFSPSKGAGTVSAAAALYLKCPLRGRSCSRNRQGGLCPRVLIPTRSPPWRAAWQVALPGQNGCPKRGSTCKTAHICGSWQTASLADRRARSDARRILSVLTRWLNCAARSPRGTRAIWTSTEFGKPRWWMFCARPLFQKQRRLAYGCSV